MHELAISNSILEVAHSALAALPPPPPRVLRVDVRVGRLTGVVPDVLRQYHRLLTAGTALDGSVLAVELVPVRGRCSDCAADFEVDDLCFTCVRCGSGFLRIASGKELEVVALETADETDENLEVSHGA